MKKPLSSILFIVIAASANIVLADHWPNNVTVKWNVIGNYSPGVLSIDTQTPTGKCMQITGSIYANSIEGFYFPYSGRIQFLRKDVVNNDTFQVWTGNLSEAGSTLRMGGTFTSVTLAGGPLGEYNFQASQP